MERHPCRALVVEDDEPSRDVLRRLLEKHGVSVCIAGTLAEADAQLEGQDVLFLDLNLPDGPGAALLERVRRERRPLKVALTTGSDDADALERAIHLRPDAVLPKPIEFDELSDWLRHEGWDR